MRISGMGTRQGERRQQGRDKGQREGRKARCLIQKIYFTVVSSLEGLRIGWRLRDLLSSLYQATILTVTTRAVLEMGVSCNSKAIHTFYGSTV